MTKETYILQCIRSTLSDSIQEMLDIAFEDEEEDYSGETIKYADISSVINELPAQIIKAMIH